MCRTYSTYRIIQKCIQGFSGKTRGKGALGRLRCRWEDNTEMDFQEVGRILGTGLALLKIGTNGEFM